jgi:hypothetical protein
MIVYRHADARFPFLWEGASQPPARWHGPGEGPVRYFADTPDGARAEFLRHEGIVEESEVVNVRRAMWAVEAPDDLPAAAPRLSAPVLTGGIATYEECTEGGAPVACQRREGVARAFSRFASRRREGWKVDGGLQPAAERDGTVLAVFGSRPDFGGWMAAFAARPRSDLLGRVRHLLCS